MNVKCKFLKKNVFSLPCFVGLVDVSESPSEAAIRELKEETGFTGILKHKSPGKFTSESGWGTYAAF